MQPHFQLSQAQPPPARRCDAPRPLRQRPIQLQLPLWLCLLPALAVLIPSATARPFSPESAAAFAVAHNPDLAVARAALEEARARVLQAGNLANPELETEVRPNLAGREFSAGITYSQRFPLTHRLRLEKELSQAAVKTAEIEIQSNARSLAAEVKKIAIQGLSLKDRKALLSQQTTAARELVESLKKSAAAGESPPLEAAQLELEVSQLAILTLQADAELATLAGSLRPRLGAPPDEPITFTGSLAAPTPAAALPANAARHPAYQAALAKSEAALRSIDLVRAKKWEDLTVGVGYERSHMNDAGEGMERENSAVLRFSIPLPLRRDQSGHLAEAEAAARRTVLEADAVAATLRAEAAAAVAEMKAHAAIHAETSSQLLPQATELESRFTQLQKSGQAPMADVLRARRQRLALESAALDARRDFHLARIRYEAASGR